MTLAGCAGFVQSASALTWSGTETSNTGRSCQLSVSATAGAPYSSVPLTSSRDFPSYAAVDCGPDNYGNLLGITIDESFTLDGNTTSAPQYYNNMNTHWGSTGQTQTISWLNPINVAGKQVGGSPSGTWSVDGEFWFSTNTDPNSPPYHTELFNNNAGSNFYCQGVPYGQGYYGANEHCHVGAGGTYTPSSFSGH